VAARVPLHPFTKEKLGVVELKDRMRALFVVPYEYYIRVDHNNEAGRHALLQYTTFFLLLTAHWIYACSRRTKLTLKTVDALAVGNRGGDQGLVGGDQSVDGGEQALVNGAQGLISGDQAFAISDQALVSCDQATIGFP
jgi:hypothetical protein